MSRPRLAFPLLALLTACAPNATTPTGSEAEKPGTTDTADSAEDCLTHPDADGDGYGDPDETACDGVADATDCDDTDATVSPGATETCDGIDQDCDSVIDDGVGGANADADGDGHGDLSTPSCDGVTTSDDCDDTNAAIYPGAPEVCDGVANDCSGGEPDAGGVCDVPLGDAARSELYSLVRNEGAGAPAPAGDVDGDGTPDLLVASYGPAYVVSGALALANPELDLADAGVALSSGVNGDAWYPWYVADAIPDVDGDGRGELVLGDPNANTGYGAAWIVRGTPTAGDLDDVAIARLDNGASEWGQPGYGVAYVGDTDGDGGGDVLIGAPYADDQHGRAWIVPADVTGDHVLDSDARTTFTSPFVAFAGISLASAGDVDGDGLGDVLVAGSAASEEVYEGGVVWLVLAPGPGTIDLSSADATIWGESSNAYFGSSVAGLGDLDGDGLDDIATCASGNGRQGWVDVWPGTTRGEQASGDAPGGVDGGKGDAIGTVSRLGDTDLDGVADLAVPVPYYDDDGAVFVWFHGFTGRQSVADADLTLRTDRQWGGADAAGVGDIDGDGRPDLLVGTNGDSTRVTGGGSATLVLGGVW